MSSAPSPSGPTRLDRAVERCLALWTALSASELGLTWPEIASSVEGYEHRDSSRKTFQRDRAALESAGVAFEPGDFSRADYRYRLRPRAQAPRLSAAERSALGLAALSLSGSSVGRAAQLAAQRLGAAGADAPDPHGPDASAAAPLEAWRPLLPDDSDWLDVWCSAIADQGAVSFRYSNARGERSARAAWPWTVYVHAGEWYATAFDLRRGEPRIFRLDRMADVERIASADRLAPDPFTPAERADAVRELCASIPESPRDEILVAVRAGHAPVLRAAGISDGPATADCRAALGEDWTALRVEGRRRDTVLSAVLAASGEAAVLGPPDLAADLEDALDALERDHRPDGEQPREAEDARGSRVKTTAQDRISRCLALLTALEARGGGSVRELAEATASEPETVLEDAWALSLAAGPSSQWCEVSVSEDEEHVFFTSVPDAAGVPAPPLRELIPLISALGALLRDVDGGTAAHEALAGAQLKLLAAAERPELATALLTAGSRRGHADSGPAAVVVEALLEGRLLEFEYLKDTEAETRRRCVRPVRLLESGRRAYLVGLEEGSSRAKHFALERCWGIAAVDPLPGESDEPRSADSDAPFPPARLEIEPPRWGTRRQSAPSVRIAARSGPRGSARALLQDFDAVRVRPAEDGRLLGTVKVFRGPFVREVLSAAGQIAVAEGGELAAEVLASAQAVRKTQAGTRRIV